MVATLEVHSYLAAMLHIVRQHAQSWVTKGILAIICFVFVFWGVEAVVSGVNPQTTAATVNGSPIELRAVANESYRLRESYRRQFGENATPQFLRSLQLEMQATERLVNSRLVRDYAQQLGLEIGDDQIADQVVNDPSFFRDGRFDKETYLRVLRANQRTPADYELQLREQILIQQMFALIGDGVTVSEGEARAEALARDEQTRLSFVRFPAGDYMDAVPVTPEALAAWYGENGERYREAEKVNAKIIAYEAETFEDGIEVAEEEIAAVWEEGKETRFTEEHQVKARHILKRSAPDAPEEVKAEARAEIESLVAELEGGADFAALATEHSDDPGSATRGGDLGFFGKGRMVASFEEAAFALEPGTRSGIVESPFGFHVIQVDEVRPERVRELDEVREEIEAELRTEQAGGKAREAAEADRETIAGGGDITEVAAARGIEVQEPAPLARNDTLAGIGRSFPLMNALFDLEVGEATEATDVNGTFVVAVLEEKVPAAIPELATVEAQVELDYRREHASVLAQTAADELLAAAQAADLATAAAAAERDVQESEGFVRGARVIQGIGSDDALRDAAFALVPEAPLAERSFVIDEDAFVVALAGRDLPEGEELDSAVERTREQMENRSRSAVLQRWIAELRADAEIRIYNDNIERIREPG